MNWLNIELSTLRKPQFVGSDPESRGVWLCVLAYCVTVENGGVIEGGSTWKDRQWQQTCGVTLKEIRKAKKLFAIVGEDISVWGYPVEKENEVRHKRETAKLNGQKGGRPVTSGKPTSVLNGNQHPKAEGEGKEKGSIERNGAPKKEPEGDHADFIKRWTTEYPQYHSGEQYLFQGGKDGKHVSQLLALSKRTPEQLQRIFITAWKHKDEFNCKMAGSIGGLLSRFNEIVNELNALHPKDNGGQKPPAYTKTEWPEWLKTQNLTFVPYEMAQPFMRDDFQKFLKAR